MPGEEIERVVAGLTDCEIDLLTGRAEGWGSWMFTAGQHLCSLGLGTERNGSISFDTPLAQQARQHLLEQSQERGEGE